MPPSLVPPVTTSVPEEVRDFSAWITLPERVPKILRDVPENAEEREKVVPLRVSPWPAV
jgi:hypothetical protein